MGGDVLKQCFVGLINVLLSLHYKNKHIVADSLQNIVCIHQNHVFNTLTSMNSSADMQFLSFKNLSKYISQIFTSH